MLTTERPRLRSRSLVRTATVQQESLSLRRNIAWTLAGKMFYAACQWGMLVALARLSKPEMVGQFVLATAVTAPVLALTNLQLRGVQATDAKKHYQFGDYLALRIATTLLGIAVVAVIALFGGYGSEVGAIILIVGLSKGIESICDVLYGLFQQHERMDRIALSLAFRGALSLPVMALVLYWSQSLLWATVALAAVWGAALLSYDLPQAARFLGETIRPRWSRATGLRLAWLALPVGVTTALLSLETNAPRFLIEQRLGEGQLGIFAALAYFILAGQIVISAVIHSALPRLAKQYAAGNLRSFLHLIGKLVLMCGGLGVLAIAAATLFGKPILKLCYGPEYAAYDSLFVLISVVAACRFVYLVLHHAVRATRMFRAQFVLQAASFAVLLLACSLLIQPGELAGAAWAMLIASVFQLVSCSAVCGYALAKQSAVMATSV